MPDEPKPTFEICDCEPMLDWSIPINAMTFTNVPTSWDALSPAPLMELKTASVSFEVTGRPMTRDDFKLDWAWMVYRKYLRVRRRTERRIGRKLNRRRNRSRH